MSSKKLYFLKLFLTTVDMIPTSWNNSDFHRFSGESTIFSGLLEETTTHLQFFVFPTIKKNSYFRKKIFREVTILKAVLRHTFYQPRTSSHDNAGPQN